MKRMSVLAILTVFMAVPTACKKEASAPMTDRQEGSPGSAPSSKPPIDAAVVVPVPPRDPKPPEASGPYTLPGSARTLNEHEARSADATALGTDVALRLVDKLGEDNDGFRRVDEMLVLSGVSSTIIEVAYDLDDAAAHKNVADGTLALNAPLSPPRAFNKDDAKEAPNMLPFGGPLLYLRHGKSGTLAVAHDGDTLMAWRLVVQHAEGAEGHVQDWFVQAKVKLASGANVIAH